MNWRNPPEGATWIGLVRNWENKWCPLAFGKNREDCRAHLGNAMRRMAMHGAQFYGMVCEVFDSDKDYEDPIVEKPDWTRPLPSGY